VTLIDNLTTDYYAEIASHC